MTRNQLIKELSPLRLGAQRQARMIRRLIEFSLPPKESVALTLLTTASTLHPKELSARLGVSRPRVSQILQKLADKGLIELKQNKHDARSREVKITPKGSQVTTSLASINEKISRSLASAIPMPNQSQFISYMKRFADGLGARPLTVKGGAFPLMAEQSRIAAATGTLSNSYMGTGRPVSEIHTLLKVGQNPSIALASLVRIIPLDISSISRLISRLEREQLLVRETEAGNRKSLYLKLTSAGAKELERISMHIDKQHRAALESFTDPEIKEFCTYLSLIESTPPEKLLSGNLEVLICKEQADFQRARQYLVENLVRSNQHASLSAMLLPEAHCVAILEHQGKVGALCELVPDETGLRFGHYFCSSKKLYQRFFFQSIKLAALDTGMSKLLLTKSTCPEELHGDMGLSDKESVYIDSLDLLTNPVFN